MRRVLLILTLVLATACHPHDARPVLDDGTHVGRVIDMATHDWGHGTSYYIRIGTTYGKPTLWLVITSVQFRGCREYPALRSMWAFDHCE